MSIGAVDKIKPLGAFKVIDAGDVEEGPDALFMKAAERVTTAKVAALAGPGVPANGLAGAAFDTFIVNGPGDVTAGRSTNTYSQFRVPLAGALASGGALTLVYLIAQVDGTPVGAPKAALEKFGTGIASVETTLIADGKPHILTLDSTADADRLFFSNFTASNKARYYFAAFPGSLSAGANDLSANVVAAMQTIAKIADKVGVAEVTGLLSGIATTPAAGVGGSYATFAANGIGDFSAVSAGDYSYARAPMTSLAQGSKATLFYKIGAREGQASWSGTIRAVLEKLGAGATDAMTTLTADGKWHIATLTAANADANRLFIESFAADYRINHVLLPGAAADTTPQATQLGSSLLGLTVALADVSQKSSSGLGASASTGIAGPVAAIMGDSTGDMDSDDTVTSIAFNAAGYFSQANMQLGQYFNYTPALNFAKSGATLSQIAAQVADVIAARPQFVFIHAGTNSLPVDSLATMQALMHNVILYPLIAAGIMPVVQCLWPRGGANALTASDVNKRLAFNSWLRNIGRGAGLTLNTFTLAFAPMVLDATPFLEDLAAGNGQPLAGVTYDGLHPTVIGASRVAKLVVDAFGPYVSQRLPRILSPRDAYHPIENREGDLLGGIGAFAAAGGTLQTQNGLTPTGTLGAGWKAYRGTGTSTATMAMAREARTDIASGYRQRMTVNAPAGGSATETYVLQQLAAINTVAENDVVFAECGFELLTAPVNLIGLELQLVEQGPATPKQSLGNARQIISNVAYPLPSVASKGRLRTPPLRLQAGVTGLSGYVRAVLQANTASASIDVAFVDYQDRKII